MSILRKNKQSSRILIHIKYSTVLIRTIYSVESSFSENGPNVWINLSKRDIFLKKKRKKKLLFDFLNVTF